MDTKIKNLARDPRPLTFADSDDLGTILELEDLYASVILDEERPSEKKDSTIKTGAGGANTAEERVWEGGRNTYLFSLAGSMRRRGMGEDAIFSALMAENKAKCEPPLHEAEVRGIAQGIQRYEAEEPFFEASGLISFPLEVLPPAMRRLATEAAAAIGCPPDFIAIPMLTVLGGAIGNSRVLRVKKGWEEGAALYTMIVGEPGDKKSPALKVATAPAWDRQAELKREYDEEMADYRLEKARWETEKREAQNNGVPAPEPPAKPVLRRTVVNDTTTEALLPLLAKNPKGVVSYNDELSGLVKSMDQYKGGKGSDRQKYLSMWDGSPVALDRKGEEEPLIVPRPCLGITGGIQPDILPEIRNNREDGFLDRFLPAFPEKRPSRWTEEEISDEARAEYKRLYDRLYALEMGENENGNPEPRLVEFTPQGKRAFAEACDSLSEESEHPDFPAYLKGPWSKMHGHLARLSLILATARSVGSGTSSETFDLLRTYAPAVAEGDVKAAISLIRYFKAHLRKVHAKLNAPKKEKTNGEDRVASALPWFVEDRGGYWEGTTSELYEIFEARSVPGLPGGAVPFGKLVRKIANEKGNDLVLEEGWRGSNPVIKLSLSTLGTVGDAGISATEGTYSKREEGNAAASRKSRIAEAIQRLFEEHREYGETPDPDAVAVDLFWFDYLDFIPEEDEVERVLDRLFERKESIA